MKSKNVVQKIAKSRRTLSKKIKTLAATDIRAAMRLAESGKPQFSSIETQINLYYHSQEELKQLTSGKKSIYQEAHELAGSWSEKHKENNDQLIKKFGEKDKETMAKILFDALNSRDSKRFFEIGSAIEFLKSVKPCDSYRPDLLRLKWILDKNKGRLSIREVAEFIGWHDLKSEDGFSQLRRLCVKLKFPLKASRQIREINPSES
jgi:hypothetical protein